MKIETVVRGVIVTGEDACVIRNELAHLRQLLAYMEVCDFILTWSVLRSLTSSEGKRWTRLWAELVLIVQHAHIAKQQYSAPCRAYELPRHRPLTRFSILGVNSLLWSRPEILSGGSWLLPCDSHCHYCVMGTSFLAGSYGTARVHSFLRLLMTFPVVYVAPFNMIRTGK